jgi:arginine deiminase
VHSPDSGLGKVVPSKAQDWLFEDIVHLDTIRKEEYDYYTKILLYFLDPEKISGKLASVDHSDRGFFKPTHPNFHASKKVLELEWLLAQLLENRELKAKLVASVTALEGCRFTLQEELLTYPAGELAKTLLSGISINKQMLFAPIPNLIFTRDLGIVIKDHILLNQPAKKARTREALLARYLFYHHSIFSEFQNKIIELSGDNLHFLLPEEESNPRVSVEGGDIMVVSENHLLIGVSERTTPAAAAEITREIFARNLMEKVTIIRIPKKRDYMHIDTLFTQVKRDVWVMLGSFSRKAFKHEEENEIEKSLEIRKEEKIKILQFEKSQPDVPKNFDNLEDLLVDISKTDWGFKTEVKIIFSGNDQFPYNVREQWTDSCNLLALKEGVVLGYDRNDKTVEAFHEKGFNSIPVKTLLEQLENGTTTVEALKNTLILMPSAELSRARGGFHCMSLPLKREKID